MMKSIEREKVLRLNCPGFGEESHLNLGRAKSLDNYQVIIANPVSLLHLFDKGPEPTRRINQLLEEGVNQLNVPDDSLIQELINESDARLEELIPFLSQGGLLIYFLCRPFVLAGPSISVDNYDWLSVYAPASKSPDGTGSRQMSALSHGRVIETTDEGNTSEVFEYLDQSGIEWNTIIRTDFLSSNYSVLATAAQKKCISAQFWAGDNGGKVIFLPAPYSPDFDRVLMVCVNKWYQEAINKGFIKDGSVVVAQSAPDEAPLNSEKVPNHTMDEARLEEIMANLAANHQKKTEEATEPAASPASEAASKAKQAPKGALKGLFSSDALDPFDDDEEFTSAAVLSTPATTAPSPALTAEEILNSVSAEASKQTPDAFQAMEAIELSTDVISEPVESVSNAASQTAAPELAMVNNFELKKATAEMDLSQFAETARQLVEQANQIETATRDPNSVSAANPKQRISDILKGLEFGATDDNDVLEPIGSEITDVVSSPVSQSHFVSTAEPANSQASLLMESLEAGALGAGLGLGQGNVQQPLATEPAVKIALTPAEIERAEIEAASLDLDSVLRPGAEGSEKNWLDTDRYLTTDDKQPEPINAPSSSYEESAKKALEELAAKELERMEAERATKTMEEFRQTFEFLTEEDPAAREYQPESILPAEIRNIEPEPQPITSPPPVQQEAPPAPQPEPEIFLGIPKPPVVNSEDSPSTLRSLVDTFGAPRLDAPVSADKPAIETPTVKDELKIDSLTTPVAAPEETMNTSFTSFEEEQTQAAKDLAEITRLAKAIDRPIPSPQEALRTQNPANPISPVSPPASIPAADAPPSMALPLSTSAPPLPHPMPEEAPAMALSPLVAEHQVAALAAPSAPAAAEIQEVPASPLPVVNPVQAQVQAPMPDALPEPVPTPAQTAASTSMSATNEPASPALNSPSSALVAPLSASTNGDGNHKTESHPEPPAHSESALPVDHMSTPTPPKELIKKMEEMTKTAPSTWCEQFSFPFIDLLKNEHNQMAEQIKQMQARLSSVEARISAVETLKLILLTGENVALMSSTQDVLSRLGWQVQQSRTNINELWLSRGDQVEAIARVVHSTGGANRTEVAQLAESVIAFWDEYETEPKGILIAQTWSSKHPSERSEPDFSPALQEFASKKHLSLMSTMQLLSMYKDIELNTMPVDEMRKRMIDTSGRLLGFPLDSNVAQAAVGR
ncbi:MAG: hypothetical protein WC028_07180 [Candidatus Obscuribacterales bacterium]